MKAGTVYRSKGFHSIFIWFRRDHPPGNGKCVTVLLFWPEVGNLARMDIARQLKLAAASPGSQLEIPVLHVLLCGVVAHFKPELTNCSRLRRPKNSKSALKTTVIERNVLE